MHAIRRTSIHRPLPTAGAALAFLALASLTAAAQDPLTAPAPGLDDPRGAESSVPAATVAPARPETVSDGRTNLSATAIIRQLAPIRGGNPNAPVPNTPVVVDVPAGKVGIDPARAVDLTVFFAFDSDRLLPEAVPQLDALAAALNAPELAQHSFLVGGHTDAKGRAGYNKSLSERRALAVVRHLVRLGGVSTSRLVAYGWGEARLKVPSDPLSGANRRVEVALIVPREASEVPELADPRLRLASDALDDFHALPTP